MKKKEEPAGNWRLALVFLLMFVFVDIGLEIFQSSHPDFFTGKLVLVMRVELFRTLAMFIGLIGLAGAFYLWVRHKRRKGGERC